MIQQSNIPFSFGITEAIIAVVAVLFVVGIPLAIAIWMIAAKMRRKVTRNYEPPIFQELLNFVPPELGFEDEESKRCPTCKSTYTDKNLIFCLTDGTPLDLVVKTLPVDNLPVTRIVQKPFIAAPTVFAKKDADDLPETVQSPYFTPEDKDKI